MMNNNVTEAVTAGLLGDSVSTTPSWLPMGIPPGLLNITVSMSGSYNNVSISYGGGTSGTETWESLSSTATTMVYDRHLPKYPQLTLVTLCVVLGCMIVATILGNVFVITAILVERSLQGVSNYLILSLAVTDLLVAVLVMPLSLLNEVSVHWYLGRALCDMWVSVDVLCCTASILHLVAIAMDRFWAVSKIDYVRRRCARQILLMIASVWLVSVAISIPPLFGWRHESDNPELSGMCMISQDHGYTIFSTVGAFYCPLVLMLVLNFKIYRAARFRIRRKGFTHPVRKSRRTGNVALPVVQVEQETTARDALRNSSGSDVSQDGISMFNPSCLLNNEISRMDTGLDSNTGDYDNAYSYGGESSDSRQNDSYYPLATEDPDGPVPSPCFAMGPVIPAANTETDKPCVDSIHTNCAPYQLNNSVGSALQDIKVDNKSYSESEAKCAHCQVNSVGPVLPDIKVDNKPRMENGTTCDHCRIKSLGSVSPCRELEKRPCVDHGANCAHCQLSLTSPGSPLKETDEKSWADSRANCVHCQMNSVGPVLLPHVETDNASRVDSGFSHVLNQLNPGGPSSTHTQRDNSTSPETGVNYDLQLSLFSPTPPPSGNMESCVESCNCVNSAHHQQLNSMGFSSSPAAADTEVGDRSSVESCANCAHHQQLNSMSFSSPVTDTEAEDRSCMEPCANCAHKHLNHMGCSSPDGEDAEAEDKSCMETDSVCDDHHHLNPASPLSLPADSDLDMTGRETSACCDHHYLNPASPVSPPTDSDVGLTGKEGGACCVRHQLNSTLRSLSSRYLAESQLCVDTFFHHLSTSDVNHCVSCDVDALQGSKKHSAGWSSGEDSLLPVQITIQECDCSSASQCKRVQVDDNMVEVNRDKETSVEASDGLRPAEGEAGVGDEQQLDTTSHTDARVTDYCPNQLLSVDLNCVNHNHSGQLHQLQGNHVECADTGARVCPHNLPGTKCLHVPNTHNSTPAPATTTTSLSGRANQLKVPHGTSVHTRQPSKSRANNNTKRARNREKEKQRREKLEMRRERKAARVLGIITGAFVLCWLPFFILALLYPFLPLSYYVPPVLTSMFLWLGYFNSLLNPIIYTIFNPSFRKAFRKIFFKRLSSVTR
ncbi:hypothetical protein ACOMHN_024715 [Nucella lapillus]